MKSVQVRTREGGPEIGDFTAYVFYGCPITSFSTVHPPYFHSFTLKAFFIKTNIKCVAKLRKHLPIFIKISIFSILFFVTRFAGGFCVANLRSQKYN